MKIRSVRREAALPRGLAIAHPSLAIARAEGARVWDTDGKEYLDFACGIGCLLATGVIAAVTPAVRHYRRGADGH